MANTGSTADTSLCGDPAGRRVRPTISSVTPAASALARRPAAGALRSRAGELQAVTPVIYTALHAVSQFAPNLWFVGKARARCLPSDLRSLSVVFPFEVVDHDISSSRRARGHVARRRPAVVPLLADETGSFPPAARPGPSSRKAASPSPALSTPHHAAASPNRPAAISPSPMPPAPMPIR